MYVIIIMRELLLIDIKIKVVYYVFKNFYKKIILIILD